MHRALLFNNLALMFTIENEWIRAVIQAKGAELTSLYSKAHQLEYLWQGDPAYWAKHSPVLFPVVGALKDNTYYYQGKAYQLSRHGFARDKPFAVETHTADTIALLLRSDEETLRVFPFSFELRIRYTLYENSLAVAYSVINTGKEDMYFSLGAHPAFNVPLAKGLAYSDYELVFDKPETAGRWPIAKDGLIEAAPIPLLQNNNILPLTKALFHKDALVFKNLASSIVSIRSPKSERSLQLDFPGFPYLGIWAAKDADFVCLEPWCGIADSVHTNQQLAEKEGINKLIPCEEFVRAWTVAVK